MSRYTRRYPKEFRRQMVKLVRAGRTPTELAHEFEPTVNTIRNCVKQAAVDAGEITDELRSTERDELRELRRENRRLREERDILKNPRPGSRGREPTVVDDERKLGIQLADENFRRERAAASSSEKLASRSAFGDSLSLRSLESAVRELKRPAHKPSGLSGYRRGEGIEFVTLSSRALLQNDLILAIPNFERRFHSGAIYNTNGPSHPISGGLPLILDGYRPVISTARTHLGTLHVDFNLDLPVLPVTLRTVRDVAERILTE